MKYCLHCLIIIFLHQGPFFGIDWNGPIPYVNDDDTVRVSEIFRPLQDMDVEELKQTVNPLAQSANYGVDLYLNTLSFIQTKLN